MAEKLKNSEKYSIVPEFIRNKMREYLKKDEDQESPKPDEKQEKLNASMGEARAKGGMIKGYAKGGMVVARGNKLGRSKPCKIY